MEFNFKIQDPQHAVEFARQLAAFGKANHLELDEVVVKAETEADLPYVREVEALLKPMIKVRKVK